MKETKDITNLSVEEYIIQVQEEVEWLTNKYIKKEAELKTLRKTYSKLTGKYKYKKRPNESTKEKGREYLTIINELIRLDKEEGDLLMEIRGIKAKQNVYANLLDAYAEVQELG